MAQSRRSAKAPPAAAPEVGVRILKRYPNRRRYDPETRGPIPRPEVTAMALAAVLTFSSGLITPSFRVSKA